MAVAIAAVLGVVLGLVVGAVTARALHARPAPVPRAARPAGAGQQAVVAAAQESGGGSGLEAVLERVPYGIVQFDRRGSVVFANAAGQGFLRARHGRALVEAEMRRLASGLVPGEVRSGVVEVKGPPRQAFELVGAASERAHGSRVVLIDDVTERRHLEEVRRDFVANISHELRTPVGAMALLAETMIELDDVATMRELADKVHGEALRIGETIDDLLILSRIERDDLPVREPVSVVAAAHDAVERVEVAAVEADVAIDVSGEDVVVHGDRRQIVSALFNLVDNAVKYSEPGSKVLVRVSLRQAAAEIEVEDEGVGIPARDLDRVFERFFRVDRARSRRTGGTGLGLAIVRHVAVNHGGDVTIRSVEGEGTTVVLRLACVPGEPGRGGAGSGSAAPDGPGREIGSALGSGDG